MNIENIWQNMEEDNTEVSNGYLTRLIFPDLHFDVYLAIEKPDNRRLLMIRVKSSSVERGTVYPTFNCFEIRRVALPNEYPSYCTFQLILSKPAYTDIFTALVQDIANSLESIEEEEEAVAEFISRLQRWQKFLEKHDRNELSRKQQQGLYGELWFLQHKAITLLGINEGVRSWTGATGTQQDFQFNQCAVEVKTTGTKKPQRIAIASERQLDDTGVNDLILFHLSLDTKKSGGESLPEIVADIRSLIAQDLIAAELLENALFEVGYLDIHAHLYEQNRYIIKEINYFLISENFPKIIEADLRNGVGDVRYTISVDQCKNFCISENRANLLMSNILS